MSDPYLILGIGPDADDTAVEQAYRDAIKRCPPDRDPAAFKAVRAAYERLRTHRDRVAFDLFDTEPPTPSDLLQRALGGAHAQDRPDPQRLQALCAALLRGES